MPKKKVKKAIVQDFTINDCANAPKPIRAIKKTTVETLPDLSWDDIDDNIDILEEINADGSKNFVYKKKQANNQHSNDTGNIYPEIIWYLISQHIKPEDVGCFARINKSTHSITKQKSFWHNLYRKYCENNPKLPEKLRSDSNKSYGFRQTVIRALHHTYDVFIKRNALNSGQGSPHSLVNRRCVTVWYNKGTTYWSVYFKLKEQRDVKNEEVLDAIEELGRIDANTEEDTKVLQVLCKTCPEVPPVMGMTLSSVTMTLAPGLRQYRLQLGFHSSRRGGLVPERLLGLHAAATLVVDWWQPQYPQGRVQLPRQEVLMGDFFEDD